MSVEFSVSLNASSRPKPRHSGAICRFTAGRTRNLLLCTGRKQITRRIPGSSPGQALRLALRAIGYADVRSGILPAQSGSPLRGVRNDGVRLLRLDAIQD